MQHVRIHGTSVPALGLGTWQIEGDACRAAVAHALAFGYRHIDTAQAYGNEVEVGDGLRESGVARDEVWVTTKVAIENLAPADLGPSVEESLRRLDLEAVDLLLLHWPAADVPLEESLEALVRVRERGWARHVGVSNYTPSQLTRALRIAPIFCNQVEYHPFLAQPSLLALAREHDLLLTAYSPLARGRVVADPVLREVARRHGMSPAQVALRWLVQQEKVCAIPASSSARHREENFRIFDFRLSEDEMSAVHALARGERLIDPPFAPVWDT